MDELCLSARWMLPSTTAEADDGSQPDAEEAFDQTGFELPPWREPLTDPRQGSLFADDGPQLDPPDSEPVFALNGQIAEPPDDCIQPDAPESFSE